MPPAMVGKLLLFHLDQNKYGYILYQGFECKQDKGWGLDCKGFVRIIFHLG